jgi:hypothetical protein
MPFGSIEMKKKWSNLLSGTFEHGLLLPVRVKVISLRRLIVISIWGSICNRQVLVDIGHLHVYTDWFPKSIENAQLHKNLIYTNPAGIREAAATGLPFAAVHVRRGLEWEFAFGSNRVTSNSEVLRRITLLVELRGPMTGTVYSALPNPELEALLPVGFELNSTANEFEVIHRMINADFVILAKSSMSYIAGVFARGRGDLRALLASRIEQLDENLTPPTVRTLTHFGTIRQAVIRVRMTWACARKIEKSWGGLPNSVQNPG